MKILFQGHKIRLVNYILVMPILVGIYAAHAEATLIVFPLNFNFHKFCLVSSDIMINYQMTPY